MANLTFNNQRLQFPGKGILNYIKPPGITGLAIWNGFTDSITLDNIPSVTGDTKATFYITINSNMPEPGIDPAHIFLFGDINGGTDIFGVDIYKSSSNFYMNSNVNTVPGGSKRTDDISSLLDQELFVEIIKSENLVESITINNTDRILSNYSDKQYSNGYKLIGPQLFTSSPPVDNIIFRDIKIYDDPNGTNTLIHHWKGYPAGNTDNAWVDLIGSNNGTVNGSPGVTT